jgi:hypothetical protein
LARHSHQTTSTDRVVKLGRHEEEGSRVGNQKLQPLKQATKSAQMITKIDKMLGSINLERVKFKHAFEQK